MTWKDAGFQSQDFMQAQAGVQCEKQTCGALEKLNAL